MKDGLAALSTEPDYSLERMTTSLHKIRDELTHYAQQARFVPEMEVKLYECAAVGIRSATPTIGRRRFMRTLMILLGMIDVVFPPPAALAGENIS